ncbi:MAG: chemotaxis response regulator protein-glutamate methylesterase [Candidatus Eremiobacteraeota bacterium]|nr:chemotaxis response regulator protein-glutamate methylesterase [Candidatus Eremiobacteraeota bacterium]NNM92982.1 chemotaxis response regulator protein-glutamate methylesterase [Candidatus Eremiobacteraeota bacterium]
MPRVKVLVVDDSAFMRQAIVKMLESSEDIEVVGTARSGEEGVTRAKELDPDVITMDVEMPGIGGLEAVRLIHERSHTPIIMVSALTREGAETTFRALELGAVDFIAKPDSVYANIKDVQRDLLTKIATFGRRSTRAAPERRAPAPTPISASTQPISAWPPRAPHEFFECTAIGTSTGGPVALSKIIAALPATYPTPILLVQHMPLGFTRPLADRLNAQSALHVVEAAEGMIVARGSVLVVPSGKQLELRRSFGEIVVALRDDDGSSLHVPSVDVLAAQTAMAFGACALGVILTGMGQDGVKGLRVLKDRGGFVLGQNEATCVVYGMPRAAAAAGLVDRVEPLERIAPALVDLTRRSFGESVR